MKQYIVTTDKGNTFTIRTNVNPYARRRLCEKINYLFFEKRVDKIKILMYNKYVR